MWVGIIQSVEDLNRTKRQSKVDFAIYIYIYMRVCVIGSFSLEIIYICMYVCIYIYNMFFLSGEP